MRVHNAELRQMPRPLMGFDTEKQDQRGFTLMELLMALALTGIFMSMSIPYGLRFLAYEHLVHTREGMLYDLRYSQQSAQTLGMYSMVYLSPFTSEYSVYNGNTQVGFHQFDAGVSYKDGYLQLPTNRILYDQLGNAQVGGVIRLVDGAGETDLHLYLGTGLVVSKDSLR